MPVEVIDIMKAQSEIANYKSKKIQLQCVCTIHSLQELKWSLSSHFTQKYRRWSADLFASSIMVHIVQQKLADKHKL